MPFYFVIGRAGIAPPNSGTREIAGKRMHVERDLQPLFAGHAAIDLNLLVESVFWCHAHPAFVVASRFAATALTQNARNPIFGFRALIADFCVRKNQRLPERNPLRK